jgi:hypothetical protein
METSSIAAETTEAPQSAPAMSTVKSAITAVVDTSTWVRLFGLASSSPIVPVRSSRATSPEPMASATEATVIAPYVPIRLRMDRLATSASVGSPSIER